MAFVIPRVRTRTPMDSILSARSRISVRETTSFSKRVPSIPAAIRQSMFSAPAGPSVVMMCITLIMFFFILRQENSLLAASQSLFGGEHGRTEQAAYAP